MYTILVVILVLISIALIALILLQHGEGADAGASFGSGASGTVFGARGSASFLTKATGALAAAFFVITLVLAYLSTHRTVSDNSVVNAIQGAAAAKTHTVNPATPMSVSIPPAVKTPVSPAIKHSNMPIAPASTANAKPGASK